MSAENRITPQNEISELDKPRDHCAVVGVIDFTGRDVSHRAVFSLYKQQNRGQGGAGLAVFDPYAGRINHHKGLGLVQNVFPTTKDVDELGLSGSTAIAHARYATSGNRGSDSEKLDRECLQPYVVEYAMRSLALAHNGNVPEEYVELMRSQLPDGIPFQSDVDSEVIAWKIMHAPGTSWEEKISKGLTDVVGAYSLVIETDDGDLFGVKDPLGIRPLVFAYTETGATIVSETHGLEDTSGIHGVRELKNGEMVHITPDGKVEFKQLFDSSTEAPCAVESIYIKHPNSKEGSFDVSEVRNRMGHELAREFQVPEDFLILGVPDSGLEIASGYASELGRDALNTYIVKDRYRAGIRSFIGKDDTERIGILELKFSISSRIMGQKLLIIDDSVIRGNTTRILIEKLRSMGAQEVHVASGSPKFIDTCDLGVDIAVRDELTALDRNDNYRIKSDEEIAQEIGADSIHYLSLPGLARAIDGERKGHCTNCMSRIHPIRELGEKLRQIYTPVS